MRVSIQWLNSYLKTALSTDEIVEALERTEVEIEEIIRTPELDKRIITAKVAKVTNHPNADKLKLVDIEFANKKTRVVCGAPNVRAGLVVAYTQPGTILPAGMEITEREIRGEISKGMLASGKELGISDDHSGLLELDPDLPLGISLCDIENLGEVLDVKTPANRWDMLSVLGLAREIASNTPKNLVKEPARAKIEYKNREVVKVKEIGECQRFVSGVVKIDNAAESPAWLVENLQSAGMRSINPIVDITNYVMLETGQPMHAYDAKKLQGALQVRFAKIDEPLSTLDGVARKLSKDDLVIADGSGAIGLAGVMGGASTEVDNTTTEIVLEVANFNKTTVRRMALRHGIRTEASTRFEKGLPLPLPRFAFERAMQLLVDICSAKPVSEPNDQLYGWPWIRHIGLRLRRAEAVLGTKLDERQIIDGLRARGFDAEHFSIAKEAKKHLGKPYLMGASFRVNGEDAFDCSYLIDRIYSKIGVFVGHTALGQFHHGEAVEIDSLKAGDVLFIEGKIEKSAIDHYYSQDEHGKRIKKTLQKPMRVGHNGLYIGGGKVIQASHFEKKNGAWIERKNAGVNIVAVEEFTKAKDYLGARRYVKNFNHTIAITSPWWRSDVTTEADVIEEAAKIIGYDNLPNDLPELPPMDTSSHQMLPGLMALRKDLVAIGLFEITTYSFVSEKDLQKTASSSEDVLAIENPMSHEQAYLRSSLLSSHLQTAARNKSYYEDIYGYFELARVYIKNQKSPTLTDESWHLGITVIGDDSVARVKRVFDMVTKRYQLDFRYTRVEDSLYITGRTADVKSLRVPEVVGKYGQLQPNVLQSFGVQAELSFGEITLDSAMFVEPSQKSQPLLPYQLISRDVTLEVEKNVLWQTIELLYAAQAGVERTKFLDEFSDADLKKNNRKRVSLRIWLDCGAQPKQAEIAAATDSIEKAILGSKELVQAKIC
jgi:phenylalanyl-tRNA synthetase beta subunit